MNMAVTESTEASSSAVADDWETGEAQQEEQLKTKQQQIRILKREKADREAAQAEQLSFPIGVTSAPNMAAPAEAKPISAAPRKLLRRPASGPNVSAAAAGAAPIAAADAAAPAADEPDNGSVAKTGEIPVEEEEKFKNLEKRKTAYDAARSRILGTDYKFEEVKAPVNMSCRSRSPEIALHQRPPPPAMQHAQQPVMTIIPPVNLSQPPPPLPPPHIVAAYQQMLMNQQQQQGYYAQQPGYSMGMQPTQQLQQMGGGAAVPSTSATQGYRDLFDSAGGIYTTPPPQQTAAEALAASARIRPQPLATMPLMSTALPPPNGMMYGGGMGGVSGYGRPPPSLFQNPDITFRHVPEPAARGGRRKKH